MNKTLKHIVSAICMFITTISYILAQSTSYQTLFTDATFTKSINTSLPVGVIDGKHGVSLTGAATYAIPIKLLPGTNNMIPEISISYNSQSGNGIAGYGWNISGLSIINVTNKNLYFDNNVKPVTLDYTSNPSGNPYSLDGSRLISTGGNMYAMETEKFDVIKATPNTTNALYGPQYFQVYHKNGYITEYGNSISSVFKTDDGLYPILWGVSKMIDRNNNYIEFKYRSDKRNFLIDEINYSGNSAMGILPYNKVKFYYTERFDSTRVYISGSSLGSNYLLDKIVISDESNTVAKTYQFYYASNDLHSVLQEVKEIGADGVALNSTIFKYGNDLNASITSMLCGYNATVNTTDIYSGDYDGDGKSEMLVAQKAATDITGIKHNVNFFLVNSSGYVSGIMPLQISSSRVENQIIPNTSSISPSDFDGDGKSDVLITNTSVVSSVAGKVDNIQLYFSRNTTTPNTPPVYFDIITKTPITPTGFIFDRFSSVYTNFLQIGDFDGDGASDIILILNAVNPPVGYYSTQILISYPSRNIYNRLVDQSFNFNPGSNQNDASYILTSNDIKVMDFDGDGKSDIIITKDNYCRIFTFNENSTNTNTNIGVLYSSGAGTTAGYPTKYHKLLIGDFNGDKKSDLLTINTANLAEIAFSNGKTFTKSTFTFNTPLTSTNNKNIVLGDFNGDGKTDICHSIAITNTSRKAQVYYTASNKTFLREDYIYNVSTSTTSSPTASDLLLNPDLIVDTDGDGNYEPVQYMNYESNIISYKLPQQNNKDRLTKIIDGYNRKVEFSYQPLTVGGAFYEKNIINWQEPAGGQINKINTVSLPLSVVSSVTVPDALDAPNTTNYTYKGAYLNTTGKGFIGFGTITSSNVINNMITETKNVLNTRFCYVYPKTITVSSIGNTLLNVKTYSSTTIDVGNKRFYHKIDGINDNNLFTGGFINESYTYDNYGNILTSSKNINNEETITSTNTGYTSIAFFSSATYLPTQNTNTTLRNGSSAQTIVTNYDYDAYANLKTEYISDGTAQKLIKNHYRNSTGNITTEETIDLINSATQRNVYTYDNKQRFAIKKTNILYQNEQFTYDPKWGVPLTYTGIDNLTTTYEYDGIGKLKKTTLPDGSIITNAYVWNILNGAGTSTITADNSLYYSLIQHSCRPDVRTTYDKFERIRKKENEGFNSQWVAEVISYDAKGNIKSNTAPFFNGETPLVTTNNYDAYDRLIAAVNSIGTTNISYSNVGGTQTITTTLPNGQVKAKTMDVTGKVIAATDAGNTLTYQYNSQGKQTKVFSGGNEIYSNTYDWFGNQSGAVDKNSGTWIYTYNAFGWLKYQKDNKGQEWNLTYDDIGRLKSKTGPEGTTHYDYVTSGNGINKIKKVWGYNFIDDEYTYDSYGRTINYKNYIYGVPYTYTYTYDACSNMASYTYPSGLTLNRTYDANGNLLSIKNANNTITIFNAGTRNAYGGLKTYGLGNNTNNTITYDVYGKPTNILAVAPQNVTIQNLSYSYDNTTGNILSRTDYVKNKTESFSYDIADRLTSMQVNGLNLKSIDYAANGNITQKTDAGHYTYDPEKINAVVKVSTTISSATVSEPCSINQQPQYIDYTPFNQPAIISEGGNELDFIYGPDNQRSITEYYDQGVFSSDRLYFDNYEVNRNYSTGTAVVQNQIHYITVDDRIVAMVVKENGTDKYYYTYTDNLGSILTVTNSTGAVVAEQNFDAWGRYRDPNTWEYITGSQALANNPNWLYRGYTGHEMLMQFDLINMNGRLYDPVLGRMLSPDNYIEDPYSIQGYNRYSYVVNNPMKYNDPSGQIAPLVFVAAAIIGGGINVAVHWKSIYSNGHFNAGNFFSALGVGAAAGIMGVVTGGAGSAMVAGLGSGGMAAFSAGALGGAIGGVFSTTVSSVGNNALLGDPLASFQDYAISAATGGVLGGTLSLVSFKLSMFKAAKANAAQSVKEATTELPSGPPRGAQIDPIESIGARPIEMSPSRPSLLTDDEFTHTQKLIELAKQADDIIGGKGPVNGTLKHSNAFNTIRNDWGGEWSANQYFNGKYGKGFLDVYNSTTRTIYDFKFGSAIMTSEQAFKYMDAMSLNKLIIIRTDGYQIFTRFNGLINP